MNCKYCGKALPKNNQWKDICGYCIKKRPLVLELVKIGRKIKAGVQK